ncbi:MAG: hypothetical protein A6F71_04445 [Cycloclasticus sp. symbiont of Poecilosclerida sp. M]|nr:MAG: hypothetical protein A6F71_04445 [Cycloclasticus sp. symbiont of Poecilosclerida sp. M]
MDIVLTPLILASLDEAPDLENGSLNAADIIGHSIDSILKRSRLENAKLQDGTLLNREHLLISLMLMAWAFFKNNLGEISLNQIRTEANVIANDWKLYLKEHALEEEYKSLGGALSLLNEHYFISGLIQRTLFITTGHNKIRFSNRQWHDYLIALYFKQCLTLGNVVDFGETAFNPVIYRMAGQLMRDEMVTEKIADQVLNTWQQTDNSSIVGDVLAFISWTTVPIEPSAVRKFLDEVGNYNEITRIVLLSGFGYRGLEAASYDRSAKDIRNALLPTITTMADCDACPIGDRIASSIS